jgi:hypothetical protein
MTRLLKVATPFTAWAVAVGLPFANVPALKVRVTVELSLEMTLPNWSCTATVTAGPRATPAVPVAGLV